jgi:hypothetical protein
MEALIEEFNLFVNSPMSMHGSLSTLYVPFSSVQI